MTTEQNKEFAQSLLRRLNELGFEVGKRVGDYGKCHTVIRELTVRTGKGRDLWENGFEGESLYFNFDFHRRGRNYYSYAELKVSPLTDTHWQDKYHAWLNKTLPEFKKWKEDRNAQNKRRQETEAKCWTLRDKILKEYPGRYVEIGHDNSEPVIGTARVTINIKGLTDEEAIAKIQRVFEAAT